jgi:hypothetical protein
MKILDIRVSVTDAIESGIRWNGDGSIGTRRIGGYVGSLEILNMMPTDDFSHQFLHFHVGRCMSKKEVAQVQVGILKSIIEDCNEIIGVIEKSAEELGNE